MKKSFLLIAISVFIAIYYPVKAQNESIIRGPYLNSLSSTSVVIRWRTSTPTDSKVQLATDLGKLTTGMLVTDPKSVTDHEVKITGLSAATKYFYAVGDSRHELKAFAEQYLVTAPVVGSTAPVRIWALGDFGNGSKNQMDCRDAIIRETQQKRPDAWIWLGDNAYNLGLDDEFQRHVFRVYQESFFRNTALYPSPGNHDYGTHRHNPTDISYYRIFTMPKAGEAGGVPSGSAAYYSVDYGNVHLISMDSQGELDGGHRIYDTLSQQIVWLKKDLAANKLPWVVVYFHHPPYSKGSHDSDRDDELVKIRKNLLRIFERYNVDLVLGGHSHVYERTHPLRGHYDEAATFDYAKHVVEKKDAPNHYRVGKNGQGIIYIVSGSGGQVGGKSEGYPLRAAVYYNNTIGGSMILDFNDNQLDVRWICADGEVRDQFSIVKEK